MKVKVHSKRDPKEAKAIIKGLRAFNGRFADTRKKKMLTAFWHAQEFSEELPQVFLYEEIVMR
jgi:hypothetical protein